MFSSESVNNPPAVMKDLTKGMCLFSRCTRALPFPVKTNTKVRRKPRCGWLQIYGSGITSLLCCHFLVFRSPPVAGLFFRYLLGIGPNISPPSPRWLNISHRRVWTGEYETILTRCPPGKPTEEQQWVEKEPRGLSVLSREPQTWCFHDLICINVKPTPKGRDFKTTL